MCSLYKTPKTIYVSLFTLPETEIEVPVLQPDFPGSHMYCYIIKALNQTHKVHGRRSAK